MALCAQLAVQASLTRSPSSDYLFEMPSQQGPFHVAASDEDIPPTVPYAVTVSNADAARPASHSAAMALPPAPERAHRETPAERNARKWSTAVTDFLRRDIRYARIRVDSVTEHFRVTESQFDTVVHENHRMEVETRADGMWVRGLRSLHSHRR